MKKSAYNKSVFLFIILVLMVLIAYTIVSLMGKDNVSVTDAINNNMPTVTKTYEEPTPNY